jgi:hypothetical protein
MRSRRRTLAALLLCCACFSLAASPAPGPSPVPGAPARTHVADDTTSVALETGGDLPTIQVEVNGRGPYRVAITPTIGGVTLDEALARETTRSKDGPVQLDSVQVGGATLAGLSADVVPGESGKPKKGALRGRMGLAAFHDAMLTLDFSNGIARIENRYLPRRGASDVRELRTIDGAPACYVLVGGRPVEARLDWSSPETLVLPAELRDSLGLAPGRDFVRVNVGVHSFDSLAVKFEPGRAQAMLGRGVLRDFGISFDQRRKMVRFAYRPDLGARRTEELRPFGLRMRARGDGSFAVLEIEPGSPAQVGGMEVGDLVIGIDNKSIAAMRAPELEEAWNRSTIVLNVRRGGQRHAYTLIRTK